MTSVGPCVYIAGDTKTHAVCVRTFIPGQILYDVTLTRDLCYKLGEFQGSMTKALEVRQQACGLRDIIVFFVCLFFRVFCLFVFLFVFSYSISIPIFIMYRHLQSVRLDRSQPLPIIIFPKFPVQIESATRLLYLLCFSVCLLLCLAAYFLY